MSPRPDSLEAALAAARRGEQPGRLVLPFRRVLYSLFFEPQMLFLLQHDRWSRAFRLMAMVAFLSGILLGLSKVPRILEATGDWAQWLHGEVGAIRLREGILSWERPQVLPHTTRHRGWRVDFVDRGVAFSEPEKLGPENQGIWLSPERVFFWWRTTTAAVTYVPLLDNKRAWGLFSLDLLWPNGYELVGPQIEEEILRVVRQAIPVLLVHEAILVFFHVLLYTLIFATIPVLLRSPLAAGGFSRVFTFYLYASVPPMAVAAVYAGLNLPYLDHAMVFVAGFVVYLVLAVHSLPRAPEPEGG